MKVEKASRVITTASARRSDGDKQRRQLKLVSWLGLGIQERSTSSRQVKGKRNDSSAKCAKKKRQLWAWVFDRLVR